jgi:DNA polymerase-3 subunit delta'
MWRTLGQPSTIERLSRSIAEGTPHHAYLFLGPAHVGKRTLAIDFACALNCESGEARAAPAERVRRNSLGREATREMSNQSPPPRSA